MLLDALKDNQDLRGLYATLGVHAVELARQQGLPESQALALLKLLTAARAP